MTSVEKESVNRLRDLSECCICLTTYTDPRILPCFHTACLKCFEDIQSKNDKNPGDALPCPLCRKEFTIPPKGMKGLQKNFFIEGLMEVTKVANLDRKSVPCNICKNMKQASDVNEATMRCLNCRENYCLNCSNIHTSQKLAKDHKIVELNSDINEEEIRKMLPVRKCKRHSDKALDYYCSDCKTVVCVSCYVVDHQTHKCKEVETVHEKFRQRLEESSKKMFNYTDHLLSKKTDMERQKREFLEKTLETENDIKRKSQELKLLIDQHANDLLDELSMLKQTYQMKMETEFEEIEMKLTVVESFVTYCTELKSKGSPSEVCDCAENLISRAKELNEENEEVFSSPFIPVAIKFIATDQKILLQNVSNVIGKLSEFERCAIVFGSGDGLVFSNDAIIINLNRPHEVFHRKPIPTQMQMETAAAANCDSIFVTGVGKNCDEIWRFDATTCNWKKCASMVKGRQRHSVAFVDHVLYICGGWVESNKSTLDDVEAYDIIDDKCTTVGKLHCPVQSAGNCVPFNGSLYIFGGCNANNEAVSNVQVYDTKLNTCTLLTKPLPRTCRLLRAVLWGNCVIFLGLNGCFIYNFDTETWKVRDQFKTDVDDFGLIIDNGKIFIIDSNRRNVFVAIYFAGLIRSSVRCIPVANIFNDSPIQWKYHARMPPYLTLYAYGKIDFSVTNLWHSNR